MSYATFDFSESIARSAVSAADIDRVIAAWGTGSGMGTDAGHYQWSDDSVTEWNGGFLFQLKDGRFAYLTGWCDYTGWGCQDGVELSYYDTQPTLESLKHESEDHYEPSPEYWDLEPIDLNKWLRDGAKDPDA